MKKLCLPNNVQRATDHYLHNCETYDTVVNYEGEHGGVVAVNANEGSVQHRLKTKWEKLLPALHPGQLIGRK